MKRLEKPIMTMDTIKDMEDMTCFTHALLFDDLLIVAQKETNCFVLKSNQGLIVIDAIWPAKEVFDAIVSSIEDVGWNPNDIKKLVITHGHVDHTGCGKWLVNAYQVQTYLSKTDDLFWEEHPVKEDRPETWKDYKIDTYITEGDIISLGDKSIQVYSTPGHTPGGLSFIFSVIENGQEYKAALWGGSTPPFTVDGTIQYLKSLDHFLEEAEKHNVTVALSNHTAFDNGQERIHYARNRLSYMPNIYVIGASAYRRYCQIYRTLCYDRLEQLTR